MSALKRIHSWKAKRRADQAALSPSARAYNALVNRFENRGVLVMALIGIGPASLGYATIPLWPDPTVGLIATGMATIVGLSSMVGVVEIFSSRTPKSIQEAQLAFYQSAGIEEITSEFRGKLKPGALMATFPRTLADGRSGMIEVICDSAGDPQLLFMENPAATFIGAPSLGTISRGQLKEVAA